MPLCLRQIEPINVGQKQSTRTAHDNKFLESSTEETAAITLSNLIQQLASLGQHAADIFERLETEVNNINDHAKILKTRVDTVENHINVSICTLLVTLQSGLSHFIILCYLLSSLFSWVVLPDQAVHILPALGEPSIKKERVRKHFLKFLLEFQ